MNILITGANGQLGRQIKDYEAASMLEPRFICHFTDLAQLDITNGQQIKDYIRHHNIEAIINCAAYTDVDGAEKNQELAYKLNDTAVGYLSEIASNDRIQLIHISTDYVFSGQHYMPYQETDEPLPQSIYGLSKLAGEKKVLENQAGIVIRTAWLYSSHGKNFVKTISNLSKEKNQLKVVYDQIGNPTYAADLVQTIFIILKHTSPNHPLTGIYHFANEGVCSWYDLAMTITELEGTQVTITPIETKDWPTPAKRPNYSVLNKAKIKNAFDVSIPYWKDSLKQMLKA